MDVVPPILTEPVIWTADRAIKLPSWPVPSLLTAMLRGFACSCPACGTTKMFRGYLRVVDDCSHCGAPLGEYRADDAPPYFTIFAVGHIVVPLMFLVSRETDLSDLVQGLIWVPVALGLTLGLLRPIKGATVGLMLRLGMTKAGQNG